MSLLSPQLEAFIAVAKLKSVHAAAKTIHITQTAVTQRLHTLEIKLATTLFLRTRRGMILTPEGEALLRYCNAVQELEGQALANITTSGLKTEAHICITGPSSIMRSRIIPQCFPVMTKFPNLMMQFNITDHDTHMRDLRSGHSQIAVIKKEDINSEINYKLLLPEKYVLVCCSAWKKRKLEDIIQSEHIIDFDPSDQITFDYLKNFKLFNKGKHERHFANKIDALALMLTKGFGYGVLTAEYSKPYLKNGELIVLNSGKIYEVVPVLSWYPRYQPPKYFSALIDAIN